MDNENDNPIIAVMQPYFMPYLGYWQMMAAVDRYVVYDDVNYIKGGWINRNRIQANGNVEYMNLILCGASPNKLINEIEVDNDTRKQSKLLRKLEFTYKKAPCFTEAFPIIEEILKCSSEILSEYLMHSFEVVNRYFEITTPLIFSSDIPKDNNLRGQDKILNICETLEAKSYYNAIGGQELYSYEAFQERGFQLGFLQMHDIFYSQQPYTDGFVPNLSIVDVMMFNSSERIQDMLKEYDVITNKSNRGGQRLSRAHRRYARRTLLAEGRAVA